MDAAAADPDRRRPANARRTPHRSLRARLRRRDGAPPAPRPRDARRAQRGLFADAGQAGAADRRARRGAVHDRRPADRPRRRRHAGRPDGRRRGNDRAVQPAGRSRAGRDRHAAGSVRSLRRGLRRAADRVRRGAPRRPARSHSADDDLVGDAGRRRAARVSIQSPPRRHRCDGRRQRLAAGQRIAARGRRRRRPRRKHRRGPRRCAGVGRAGAAHLAESAGRPDGGHRTVLRSGTDREDGDRAVRARCRAALPCRGDTVRTTETVVPPFESADEVLLVHAQVA